MYFQIVIGAYLARVSLAIRHWREPLQEETYCLLEYLSAV